jgi:hypothetical protein
MRKQQQAEAPPRADIAWERRWGRPAGAGAVLSVVATIAAVPVAATDVAQKVGDPNDLTFLTSIGQSGGGQVAAMLLRLFSILILIPLTLFLYRAVRGRSPEHSPFIPLLGVVAFVVVAVSTAIGFFEVREVARDFVASGSQTLSRAEVTLSDARGEGMLQVANVMQIIGGALFGLWISITSLEVMRVGLLTRFLGIFGIGAGVATVIGIPVGTALFLAWLGSLGLMAFGYWPGGRPAAWDTGHAVSWQENDQIERRQRHGGEPA